MAVPGKDGHGRPAREPFERLRRWWSSPEVVAARAETRRLVVDVGIPRVRAFIVDRLIPEARRVARDVLVPLSLRAYALTRRGLAAAVARAEIVLERRAPRIAAALRRVPARLRAPIAVGLVGAVVVGVVLMATRPAPEANAAAAFLGGAYVAPPYEVHVENGDIVVNGVRARPKPEAAQPLPSPPADPKDVGDLAAIAASRIFRQDVSDAEVDAVVADLRSRPVTGSVEKLPDSIRITDRAGRTTRVLYGIRARPTEDRILEDQHALALRWQRLLDAGGVLLTAEGVAVTVPPDEAAGFLADLDAAFARPAAERATALATLTGSLIVAEALLKAGAPASVKERISLWPAEADERGGRSGLLSPRRADASAETPRSKRAFIFDYFHWAGELEPVRDAMDHAGYTRTEFSGKKEGDGQRWIEAFAGIGTSGGAGFIYLSVHGVEEGTALEMFGPPAASSARDLVVTPATSCPSADARDLQVVPRTDCPPTPRPTATPKPARTLAEKRLQEYVASGKFLESELLAADEGNFSLLLLLKPGIARLFKDQNTIVQLSSCHAWHIRDAFIGARAVIAPLDSTKGWANFTESEPQIINATLYPALAGTTAGGELREFGKAAAEALSHYEKERPRIRSQYGIYTSEWRYAERDATVLAPAVSDVAPRSAVAPTKSVSGRVTFDVPMSTSVLAASVIDVRGCGARIGAGSVSWQDPRTLAFTVQTTGEGQMRFTVVGTAARSAGAGIQLLGKLQDKDATAGRDFTWTVPCEPGALGQRPREIQTRLGQFSASADRAKVGDKVTLTVAVNSGDSWLCAGEFHTPGGVRFVRIGGVPGAKLLDWSPKQLGRRGAHIDGPPQSGTITWNAGDADPEPPGCRELASQGRAPTGLFKSGDVFTATYEVTTGTGDWVQLGASLQNEQGTGVAALPFASTGQASPSPTPTARATAAPTPTPPVDPSLLLRRCPPGTLTPDRARTLAGQQVTLCYPIASVQTTGIGSTLLWSQMGPARVAAVIPASALARFTERFGDVAKLKGVLVTIAGRVDLVGDVPEVMLTSTAQLGFPLEDGGGNR